ncbi:TetR family transcriptional regulator [Tamaricihabitans halophyticus]|uniref:TetR family transcriptional regulator n=1 Tax=Tamaricihabitans halophyticus TaxID=1262583 RepID=A0A4R2R3H8_9PSEU|nr:TetR/AcrR family transcriptional regulator [Tamaricihabitans halophyticus]TCP56414.1 TetR family transcriptional regulator [Tamaricihabitans halophyticus]
MDDREARAHRILDAAAELIGQLGYDKTTVDDIATAAGVAKGTIYLHWRSRAELFEALLRRDRMGMFQDIDERIADAPDTLATVFTGFAHSLHACPLSKAVYLRDLRVLGKFVHNRAPEQLAEAMPYTFAGYLERLRAEQLIRTDISLAAQVQLIAAAFLGALHAPTLLPAEFTVPEPVASELLGESIARVLDRGTPFDETDRAAFRAATIAYFQKSTALERRKYLRAMGHTKESE